MVFVTIFQVFFYLLPTTEKIQCSSTAFHTDSYHKYSKFCQDGASGVAVLDLQQFDWQKQIPSNEHQIIARSLKANILRTTNQFVVL